MQDEITKSKISRMAITMTLILVTINAVQAVLVKKILIDKGIEIISFHQLIDRNFYTFAIPTILKHPYTYIFLILIGITFVQGLGLYTRIDAVRMALVTNLDNAMIVIFGVIIFDDPITFQLICAFLLITCGYWIIAYQLFERKD